ncbi:hypothetical protein RB195_018032 [Necator americanus]|uniref:Reverse transcriptase domain-containing protein n=1 Tax=Necator americanus TaxID=51031 RepID=A0ABR1CAT4_NECAM
MYNTVWGDNWSKTRGVAGFFLFDSAIDEIMRRTADQCPTDIISTIGTPPDRSRRSEVVDLVSMVAAAYGLRLRPDKCKQMWVPSRPLSGIRVDGQPTELVDEFHNLSCMLKNNGNYEKDIQQRCAKELVFIKELDALSASNSLTKSMWSFHITNKVKLRVQLAAVRPIMMYGLETWAEPSTLMERTCHNEDLYAEIDVMYRQKISTSCAAAESGYRRSSSLARRPSQKIEKVEQSYVQGRQTSAKMQVIASGYDISPPTKSSALVESSIMDGSVQEPSFINEFLLIKHTKEGEKWSPDNNATVRVAIRDAECFSASTYSSFAVHLAAIDYNNKFRSWVTIKSKEFIYVREYGAWIFSGRFKGKLNGAADLDHCFEEIHFDCVPRADAVFIRFDNQPEDMWAIDQIFVDTSYSLGPTDDYLQKWHFEHPVLMPCVSWLDDSATYQIGPRNGLFIKHNYDYLPRRGEYIRDWV